MPVVVSKCRLHVATAIAILLTGSLCAANGQAASTPSPAPDAAWANATAASAKAAAATTNVAAAWANAAAAWADAAAASAGNQATSTNAATAWANATAAWAKAAAASTSAAVTPAKPIAAATNAAPKSPPWQTTASAGLTITRGNSHTFLATLGLDSARKWDHNEAAFGIHGGYGTQSGVANANFLNGFGQVNHNVTERFFDGLRVDGASDAIAALSYRLSVTPLAGYYLIKQTNTTLVIELGPSVITEKEYTHTPETYFGLRAAERFEHKLSPTTKIWESLSYVPRLDTFEGYEKYVVTAEAGIDSAINKHWSLRLVLQDVFDSVPASKHEQNDFRLVAGVGYRF